jgi:hypothetical protein
MASVVIQKHHYQDRGTKRINAEVLILDFDDEGITCSYVLEVHTQITTIKPMKTLKEY